MAQSKITFFNGKKRPLRESQDDCDGVPKKTSAAENKEVQPPKLSLDPAELTVKERSKQPKPHDVTDSKSSQIPGPDAPSPDSNSFNSKLPSQPILKKYPSTTYGKTTRSFSSAWYKGRPWLEYSVAKDAVFCFPCRVFGVNPPETVFTVEGYRDWKHALDGWNDLDDILKDSSKKNKLRGFAKHVASSWHMRNSQAWVDQRQRISTGKTFTNVVCKLEDNQKRWVEVVFNVIRSLVANGLPLRGEWCYLWNIYIFFQRYKTP